MWKWKLYIPARQFYLWKSNYVFITKPQREKRIYGLEPTFQKCTERTQTIGAYDRTQWKGLGLIQLIEILLKQPVPCRRTNNTLRGLERSYLCTACVQGIGHKAIHTITVRVRSLYADNILFFLQNYIVSCNKNSPWREKKQKM